MSESDEEFDFIKHSEALLNDDDIFMDDDFNISFPNQDLEETISILSNRPPFIIPIVKRPPFIIPIVKRHLTEPPVEELDTHPQEHLIEPSPPSSPPELIDIDINIRNVSYPPKEQEKARNPPPPVVRHVRYANPIKPKKRRRYNKRERTPSLTVSIPTDKDGMRPYRTAPLIGINDPLYETEYYYDNIIPETLFSRFTEQLEDRDYTTTELSNLINKRFHNCLRNPITDKGVGHMRLVNKYFMRRRTFIKTPQGVKNRRMLYRKSIFH